MSYQVTMERQHKARSGVPLGGIGTGGIELRQDGVFYSWNIFNNLPIGTGPFLPFPEDTMLFFLMRYEVEGELPKMKLFQIDQGYDVAAVVSHYRTMPWLTGVDKAEFEGSFPLVKLKFSDQEMPFDVYLEAFSPFIPHDIKNSSLPAVMFRFNIKSKSSKPVDVMLMGCMRNASGYDVEDRFYDSDILSGRGYKAIEMKPGNVDKKHTSYGQQVLASLSGDSTWYNGWEHRHPYYEYVVRNKKLPNIDVTQDRNKKDPKTGKKVVFGPRCFGTIAKSQKMKKNDVLDHTFVLAWNFPNLYAGATFKQGGGQSDRLEGHYYSNFFKNAGEVVDYVVKNQKKLEGETRKFHENFYDSTAETWLLDQINSHLSTFVCSAWFTKSGDFGVQEGLTPDRNWGPLATIDVGFYGNIPAISLFPELQKNSMRVHKRLQQKNGVIAHGVGRNFEQTDAKEEVVKGRLDLPSQYACMVLRDFFWTSDREYLKEMWPSIKAALEYVVRERDMNQDGLPDMEGTMCSYDNFPMYGAASFVASVWLAALKSAVEAARILKDKDAEARFSGLLEQGDKVFEEKLWNGEYYRLYNDEDGPKGDKDEGCMTDQIMGQWACDQVGLGDLFKPARRKKALRAIYKRNFRPWGLINCSWPEDSLLKDVPDTCWDDQFNTTWSGTELEFASFLIFEGFWKEGRAIAKHVDDRYRKFGMYWDHQEFGGHYFRPMVSWLITNAMIGLTIRDQVYGFDPKAPDDNVRLFFSFSDGYAHFNRKVTKTSEQFDIEIDEGKFTAKQLDFVLKNQDASKVQVRVAGKQLARKDYDMEIADGSLSIRFRRKQNIKAGDYCRVTVK
ncbi:MAG: GH116 family glycosyl hydrolase [Candidatus Sumerlaeia bacterium]